MFSHHVNVVPATEAAALTMAAVAVTSMNGSKVCTDQNITVGKSWNVDILQLEWLERLMENVILIKTMQTEGKMAVVFNISLDLL